jgi:hypothetical protein
MTVLVPVPTAFSVVPSFQSFPFVSGYHMNVTGNTTLTVGPGAARALTNDFVIQYPSFSASLPGNISVDVSTVGLNGCYPVAISSLGLTNNQLFPVYVVTDTSGTFATGSVTTNGPYVIVATGNNFLPPNMNSFRRIGWLWVDHTTGFILPMLQQGDGNEREYLLNAPITVVSGGTSFTTPAEVDLTSTVGLIPPNRNSKVMLNVSLTGAGTSSFVYLQPNNFSASGATATTVLTQVASHALGVMVDMVCGTDATTGDAAIKYLVDSGSAVTIQIAGFTDSIGNHLA